jgi:undecaprenol kinase
MLKKNKTWVQSFSVAAEGFVDGVKKEASIRRAVIFATIFITLTCIFHTSYVDIVIIIVAWTQVIVYEFFNTAVEKVLDYTSNNQFHALIKLSKDYCAAAVFISASLGAIIFCIIMFKYFYWHH